MSGNPKTNGPSGAELRPNTGFGERVPVGDATSVMQQNVKRVPVQPGTSLSGGAGTLLTIAIGPVAPPVPSRLSRLEKAASEGLFHILRPSPTIAA